MDQNTQKAIHDKGFKMATGKYRGYEGPLNYGSIKIGRQVLEDATLNLGALKQINRKLGNKMLVLKALWEKDYPLLREISNYFYRTNGIYFRACNTAASMFRYDWMIVPEVLDESVSEDKIIDEFTKLLNFFDDSRVKKTCNEIALEVVINGAYYGYLADSNDCVSFQQLPINYCRSRYNVNGIPAIEMNMKYFDDTFPDINYRMKVLGLFPKEIQKGYMLYKQHKLPPETMMESSGSWYLLTPGRAIKFSFYNGDIPLFANAIPSIIDLDAAQELDRRKQMQQLLKILIQKLPLDKNGDLIFDVDEAADIHANAVEMLERAIGVDVLTTFADIEVEDLADKNTTATTDDLAKMERTVYNALGLSRNLFNTDGNLSLEKSILNDEGMIRPLVLQFEAFFNTVAMALSTKKKKYVFKFYMLETTQYNYKELSKVYKEQVQVGYSKMLPQIALGHSQSAILNMAHFENEVLHLSELMLPPLQSSTLNAEGLEMLGGKNSGNGKTGRPKKQDDQKAEKTIQNQESMS